MKKLLLVLLLFCQIDLSAAIRDAAEFQLMGSLFSVVGLVNLLLIPKAYTNFKNHMQKKNNLKQIIQAYGGRVLENSSSRYQWCGNYSVRIRTKQVSLEFPEYPTQNDLHEICINWNKFQELASQDQAVEKFLEGTCFFGSTLLLIGLFLIVGPMC